MIAGHAFGGAIIAQYEGSAAIDEFTIHSASAATDAVAFGGALVGTIGFTDPGIAGLVARTGGEVDPLVAGTAARTAFLGASARTTFCIELAGGAASTDRIIGDGLIAGHAFGGAIIAQYEGAAVVDELAIHRFSAATDAVAFGGALVGGLAGGGDTVSVGAGLSACAGGEVDPTSAAAVVLAALLGGGAAATVHARRAFVLGADALVVIAGESAGTAAIAAAIALRFAALAFSISTRGLCGVFLAASIAAGLTARTTAIAATIAFRFVAFAAAIAADGRGGGDLTACIAAGLSAWALTIDGAGVAVFVVGCAADAIATRVHALASAVDAAVARGASAINGTACAVLAFVGITETIAAAKKGDAGLLCGVATFACWAGAIDGARDTIFALAILAMSVAASGCSFAGFVLWVAAFAHRTGAIDGARDTILACIRDTHAISAAAGVHLVAASSRTAAFFAILEALVGAAQIDEVEMTSLTGGVVSLRAILGDATTTLGGVTSLACFAIAILLTSFLTTTAEDVAVPA